MNTFTPIHNYEIVSNSVTDQETIALMQDLRAVYRSLYQGMAPIGEWIQTRIAFLIRQWLPGWSTSHGQIFDYERPDIQSRSWDIIIHRPIPKEWGFPPPSTPSGSCPLVPKQLCCAVIDTKGQYNDPKEYAKKTVFNLPNNCQVNQLDYLGTSITAILFIIASTIAPSTVEKSGDICRILTFVMAKADARKCGDWAQEMRWHLNPGSDSVPPLLRFQKKLEAIASKHALLYEK